MAERPEDLNLPNAVVTRIIKEALPSGVNVGKDARLAISKAASVFVLYATSCANNNALKGKRKTINVNDVFTALEDMEFESFLEPLKADLEAHKKTQANKKSKKISKSKDTAPVPEVDEDNIPTERLDNDRVPPTDEGDAENAVNKPQTNESHDEAAPADSDSRMDTSS